MKFSAPTLLQNRYNAAAWKDQSGNTVLLLRHVEKAGINAPDIGKLIRLVFNSRHRLIKEEVIWQPQNDNLSFEDPRALVLENGEIAIGLTSVVKTEQNYHCYPAFITLPADGRLIDFEKNIKVLNNFGRGKNVTPFERDTFVFRKDGFDHKLIVLKKEGETFNEVSELDFSQKIPWWGSYRIGTTIPPIWLNDNLALLLIHGINFKDGIYHYAIGRAKLIKNEGKLSILFVDKDPLLTSDNFPADEELHLYRRVVYACGGVLRKTKKGENLVLYVNRGDRQTLRVTLPMKQLLKNFV